MPLVGKERKKQFTVQEEAAPSTKTSLARPKALSTKPLACPSVGKD